MRRGDHLNDADHGLFCLAVIEEAAIPNRHVAHEIAGLIVAHAVPFLARVALGQLVLPAPGGGFGFKQPILHQITFFHGINSTLAKSPAVA